MPLFHLAIPVDDLSAARRFYGDLLGCPEGRSDDRWVDFDFFGHQLVVHLSPEECSLAPTNDVDGEDVPCRHFGVILDGENWRKLADRLADAGVSFIIPPTTRHVGKPGEQSVFFFRDPAGNALEFKSFARPEEVFAA